MKMLNYPGLEDDEAKPKQRAPVTVKRVAITFVAFLVAGFVYTLLQPVLGGARGGMALGLIVAGIIFGTWKWSARL